MRRRPRAAASDFTSALGIFFLDDRGWTVEESSQFDDYSLRVAGLGQERVSSGDVCGAPKSLANGRRDNQHPGLLGSFVSFDFPRQRPAVDHWHLNVHQYRGWRHFGENGSKFSRIRSRSHLEPRFPKVFGKAFTRVEVIIDHDTKGHIR
jgi:hypothetical protein